MGMRGLGRGLMGKGVCESKLGLLRLRSSPLLLLEEVAGCWLRMLCRQTPLPEDPCLSGSVQAAMDCRSGW